MSDFESRFTFDNPGLAAADIYALTSTELFSFSPEFERMAEDVRNKSVLTLNIDAIEVYMAITREADPRIALRLGAQLKADNSPLYATELAIKQLLYGVTPSNNLYIDPRRNIFTQGLRRVSTALAASWLISRLVIADENQLKHATALENQALADLDRLLQVPPALEDPTLTEPTASNKAAFIFDIQTDLVLTADIQTSIFMAGNDSTGWFNGPLYLAGSVLDTAMVCADVADTINSLILQGGVSNVIAAPILAAEDLHVIELSGRDRDAVVSVEVFSVRFTSSADLPFSWGVETRSRLAFYKLNSVLLTIALGKLSTTALAADLDKSHSKRSVLYFRNTAIPDGSAGELSFRVTPTTDDIVTIPIPAYDPALRYAQAAELLLDGLVSVKGATKALGALIRDDGLESIENVNPRAGLELIAFSITHPQTWIILDVLALPPGVEIALGDPVKPLTGFSARPRSARVESTVDRNNVGISLNTSGLPSAGARVLDRNSNQQYKSACEQAKRFRYLSF